MKQSRFSVSESTLVQVFKKASVVKVKEKLLDILSSFTHADWGGKVILFSLVKSRICFYKIAFFILRTAE